MEDRKLTIQICVTDDETKVSVSSELTSDTIKSLRDLNKPALFEIYQQLVSELKNKIK